MLAANRSEREPVHPKVRCNTTSAAPEGDPPTQDAASGAAFHPDVHISSKSFGACAVVSAA
jgi:hypothetical protein